MRFTTYNICGGSLSDAQTILAQDSLLDPAPSLKTGDFLALQEVTTLTNHPNSIITNGPEAKQLALAHPGQTNLGPSHPEGSQSIAAECTYQNERFQILALWAKRKPSYQQDVLNTLNHYARWIQRKPTVVMGDFNLDPKIRGAGSDFYSVNARLNELGLHSAYHRFNNTQFGQEPHPTLLFNWGKGPRSGCFHCDYVYLPEDWIARIRSVTVEPVFGLHEFSDHRPVTVELV